jgi:Protein of unknown function (DUF2971)
MNETDNSYGLNDQQRRTLGVFFPHASKRTFAALNSGQRFVYYTSADTAMHILRSNEVWMRKSSLMNDYREIEHGFDCLNNAYKNHRERLQAVFDGMFPGFCEKLEALFNGWLPNFRTDTYITCVSEHDASEDQHGRLSMWRAYGGVAGVAIVFHGGPFLRPSDALKAHTSPVAYLNDKRFNQEFAALIDSVESNHDFVQSRGDQMVLSNIFSAFRHAVLCTKHPGFHEEREWRIIYSPSFQKSDRIASTIVSINGTPQSVCKIPLKDVPEEGLIGLNLPGLIDRVIIGPSRFPVGIYDALLSLLTEAGVENPVSKIIVSDLPLRQ